MLNFFKMSYRAVMSGSGIAGMQREDVVAAIVRLTGKEPKDITCLYIGTAIYNDQRGAAQYLGLETAGCSVTHLPIDATKADAEVLFLADVILVSGGNTLFAGLSKALYSRLKTRGGSKTASLRKVTAKAHRDTHAWLGGCVLAELSSWMDELVSSAEYEEEGAGIVHRMNIFAHRESDGLD